MDTGSGSSGTPLEVCANGIDDDANGLVDCQDPACPPCEENGNNQTDDDFDNLIDCDDDDCCADTFYCRLSPACVEDCVDGVDNDLDGLVDCEDRECTCI